MDDTIKSHQTDQYDSFQAAANAAKRIARITGDAFSVLRSGPIWTIERQIRRIIKNDPEPNTSECDSYSMNYFDDRTATYGLSPPDWVSDKNNDIQCSSIEESEALLQNQTEADLLWIKVDCPRCKNGVTQTGETCRFCKGAGYFDQLPTEEFIHG